jgi:hypothetical protein
MKKNFSTELNISTFLHNYFIIHDIKYFFLNKNNQPIQGGGRAKKKSREGEQITESII